MPYDPQIPPDLTDEQLGISPLVLEQGPSVSDLPPPGFLERFGGALGGQQFQQPQGFLDSFLQGAAGGLASNAQRMAAKRQQVQAATEAAARERAQANREATRAYRQERAAAIKAKRDYERDHPVVTDALLKEKPWLKRQGLKPGDRVPESVLTTAPPEPDKPRIISVETPQGTKYMTETDALKQPPFKKPTAAASRPSTPAERQTFAFYNRGKQAIDTISTPDNSGMSLEDKIANQPLLGQFQGQRAPNFLQTKEQQAYRQAQKAFTEARLRKESGAAINPSEYANDARTYFVQPGDAPETVAQKRAMRQAVLDGLKFGSGKAFEEYYTGAPGGGLDPEAAYQEWLNTTGGQP